MPQFDRYIAVDWSGANVPRRGKDSIWIGEYHRHGSDVRPLESRNPTTRAAAMVDVNASIVAARAVGERVLIGFDFVFGYPRGAARAIAGEPGWKALWSHFAEGIADGEDNRSNRFEVAAGINRRLGAHFWGHPNGHAYEGLAPTRPLEAYAEIPERRLAEARQKSAQPVWKLTGAGSVGSQSLLGIARLAQLKTRFPEAAVWPFETGFADDLSAPILLVEIYPSLFPLTGKILPRDREQVEVSARLFAELDAADQLRQFLSTPADLSPTDRETVLCEEGWIAGIGQGALWDKPPSYTRTPAAIYDESFAIIRREAKLTHLPASLHPAAIRMIHACGMVDLAIDIVGDAALPAAVRTALDRGATIFCDSEMVAAGIIRRNLAGNDIVVTLSEITAEAATAAGTTRSALAVDHWRDRLDGAIVLIGNAPTALFRLLELLDAGAPKPAAIIGIPVGFVGAAESKAALVAGRHHLPYLTVRGRRGGSAITAAAFNAIAAAQP